MPKKKQPKPRQRRDPYERALAASKKRLEKCLIEREKCEEKLKALSTEIPYLEGIIHVFQPPSVAAPDMGKRTASPIAVPSHLEKYLRQTAPRAVPVKVDSEEDTLIDPLSEKGSEVLP